MDKNEIKKQSKAERPLGIELGSTRIKAVLIAEDHSHCSGGARWENQYENSDVDVQPEAV